VDKRTGKKEKQKKTPKGDAVNSSVEKLPTIPPKPTNIRQKK